MFATLFFLRVGCDRVPRWTKGVALASSLALGVALLTAGPVLADGEGEGIDPDLWTQFVLAVVRVVLWVLHLPPIYACPC